MVAFIVLQQSSRAVWLPIVFLRLLSVNHSDFRQVQALEVIRRQASVPYVVNYGEFWAQFNHYQVKQPVSGSGTTNDHILGGLKKIT